MKSIEVIYKGVRYPTLKNACQRLGLECTRVYYLKNEKLKFLNLDINQIIDFAMSEKEPYRARKKRAFTFDGKNYKSLKDCCRALNIPYWRVMMYRAKYRKANDDITVAIKWALNPASRDSNLLTPVGERSKVLQTEYTKLRYQRKKYERLKELTKKF